MTGTLSMNQDCQEATLKTNFPTPAGYRCDRVCETVFLGNAVYPLEVLEPTAG